MMMKPKKETVLPGEFFFGASAGAAAPKNFCSPLLQTLWNGFCCRGSALEWLPPCGENRLCIGKAELLPLDGAEYTIRVTPEGVAICGADLRGLIHGYMTLLTMIRPVSLEAGTERFAISCCEIADQPAVAIRMLHLCVFPETTLPFLTKLFRLAGVLKYTHIVLEFWGMLQFDCLRELGWPAAYSKEQLRPLIREANDMGMEIVPMFNHLGHASASRMMHGKHVVLDQNPRLQLLYDEDGWTWNLQNPQTLALLAKVRRELCELCGAGSYFHIGCDEAYLYQNGLERAKQLADYFQLVTDDLASLGRRPILWADMLLDANRYAQYGERITANCQVPEISELLLNSLDRRAILADWQYETAKSPLPATVDLLARGFDVLDCPWYETANMASAARTAKETAAMGTIMTTWHTLSARTPSIVENAQLNWEGEPQLHPGVMLSPLTAALLRKVYFVGGSYPDAGWAAQQIGNLT